MGHDFIGLMSGTSLDGVDAVLCRFADDGRIEARAHRHLEMPADLRLAMLTLNEPGENELHRAALAANALARLYAQAVRQVLVQAGESAARVRALGAHGQTVRHRPLEFDGCGYSLQLLNGSLLAELTTIDTVCDFRSRDLAAGGQGAPLAPAFHAALFGLADRPVGVLNIGGISNLSVLQREQPVIGFDCGPGNALMDLWCQQHTGQPFDRDGVWADSGRIHAGLLASMHSEPYFALAAPKSTGRDLFHRSWLETHLARSGSASVAPADVMRTLLELTASTTAEALRSNAPKAQALWVCGGGAFNGQLLARLAELLPGVAVSSSAACGAPPDQIEAMAFAWLARTHVRREAGNLRTVTGALGERVLGALYPGTPPAG